MKWALCQTSYTLGDFESNFKKILQTVKQHKDCDLLIFPELFLSGYPLEDILELKDFIKIQNKFLQKLKLSKKDPAVLFGACSLKNSTLYNSAVFIKESSQKTIHKTYLATSDTFDEHRFFSSGSIHNHILKIKNKNCLVLICEDLWKIDPKQFSKSSIDFIICINASPFFPEQLKNRRKLARKLCQKLGAPLFYVNKVGGQDEWIFDGSSFVLNKKGELVFQAPSFKESIKVIDTRSLKKISAKKYPSDLSMKKDAIKLGIHDFVTNNKIKKVLIGLSGGLDSALVTQLCVEALGSKAVQTFYLKGPFSKKKSQELSQKLAKELRVSWKEYSIIPIYEHFISLFKKAPRIAKENIQARIRMLFLMMVSNSTSSFLVGASNKSELATGYGTLYGDITGAFLPIGDLYKTEVIQMVRSFYLSKTMKDILKQPMSAELYLGQTDDKDLPSYPVLDSILKSVITNKKHPQTPLEKDIFNRMIKNEFKRRQSPIVFKVSSKSFGRGRRYPITQKISF